MIIGDDKSELSDKTKKQFENLKFDDAGSVKSKLSDNRHNYFA